MIGHFNTVETQGPLVGILQPLLVGDASDTTSVQVAGFLFGKGGAVEARPPLARDYPALALAVLESFWAAPVNSHFGLSPWLPLLFSLLVLLAVAGLWRGRWYTHSPVRAVLLLLLFHTLLIVPLLAIRVFLSYDAREVAQGRHILLPAASAIAILLVWGWRYWSPKIGSVVVAGLLLWSAIGQIVWAAIVYPPPIPVWPQSPANQPNASFQELLYLDESLRLNNVSWEQTDQTLRVTLWWEALKTMPEDMLIELDLISETGERVGYSLAHPVQGRYPTRAWEPGDVVKDVHTLPLLSPLARTYTLKLRLLPPRPQLWPAETGQTVGHVALTVPITQADGCAIWSGERAGQRIRPNRTFIVMGAETPTLRPINNAAMQAEKLPFYSAGQFHVFLVEPYWPAVAELRAGTVSCGTLAFDIPKRNFIAPPVPQPLEANFNNQLQLLGIDLPTRRIQPGQRLPLTLYWRALAYMGEDYRIFANPLDTNQQRWGGYDRRPQDGYSTLRLVPGEVITDPFGIPIAPDAPDGIYTIDLGLYRETENGAESLPVYVGGQPQEQRSIRLGPIKVGGPPANVVVTDPAPQVSLAQSFGEQITLLGYNLGNEQGTRNNEQIQNLGLGVGETLKLTLFWQVDAFPNADYTTFVHLRDAANQTVAQKDGPPAAGRYPTGLWDPGEVIADEIALPLDNLSPGIYTLIVGLYNPLTGERLPIPDNPANELRLQQLTINKTMNNEQ